MEHCCLEQMKGDWYSDGNSTAAYIDGKAEVRVPLPGRVASEIVRGHEFSVYEGVRRPRKQQLTISKKSCSLKEPSWSREGDK